MISTLTPSNGSCLLTPRPPKSRGLSPGSTIMRPRPAPARRREGVELGQQVCPCRLVVMEEGDLEGMAVEAPELGHRQPERGPGARVLVRQCQRADGPVVGAQGRRDAGSHDAGQGMVRQCRIEVCLQVAGRAEVQGHAAGAQLGHERRVVLGRGAMRDAPGFERQRPANLGRTAPLAGMDRDAQTRLAGDGVGPGVEEWVGVGGLRPGQVEAGHALGHRVGGGPGHGLVERRLVGAQRDRDEAHDDRRRPLGGDRGRAAPGAGGDGGDPVAQRKPTLEVQAGAPADLRRSACRRWRRPRRAHARRARAPRRPA